MASSSSVRPANTSLSSPVIRGTCTSNAYSGWKVGYLLLWWAGGNVFGRQVLKVLDRQVVQVSAKRLSPFRYDHANTACFNKCASGVSNTA